MRALGSRRRRRKAWLSAPIPSSTIVTTKLLASKGIPLSEAHLVEMKNISIRLQMLLGGQVAAAVLAEPLATLALSKGAQWVADDAGTGWSSTVIGFNEAFLIASPDRAKAFLRAVGRASSYINANHDGARPIMNKECRIPEQLQRTFPVPEFPKLALPSTGHVDDAYQWLLQKKTLKKTLTYGQITADGYVP